jgi:hypothetical protein
MSIFDIFTPKAPAAPTPAPNPSQPGSIPEQQTVATQHAAGTDANGVVPQQPQAKKDDSPLAAHTSLWEAIPKPTADPATAHTPLDAATLQTAMSKADLAANIPPEIMAAIVQGGEGAGAAFTQAMNQVAQQSMVQSTLINEKLTAQAVERAISAMEAKIPEMLRSQASSAHVADSNPLFSNPAIKPVIDATRQQLQDTFPKDTPAQITDKLNNYVKAMGLAFNPAAPDPAKESAVDWNKFLKG